MSFGKQIATRRRKAELTQQQLAVMVGISQSYLAGIETDKVPLNHSTVAKIIEALGVENPKPLIRVAARQEGWNV